MRKCGMRKRKRAVTVQKLRTLTPFSSREQLLHAAERLGQALEERSHGHGRSRACAGGSEGLKPPFVWKSTRSPSWITHASLRQRKKETQLEVVHLEIGSGRP